MIIIIISRSLNNFQFLTIIMNVLVQHFNPQNAANLSKCLKMIDVNDKWSDCVVKNCAESLHV